ncbi:hypothetical protein SOVF_020520 [Spinacia oleracea]|uniref:BAH domain-containing protein n=1 Tax=Spinacia oleracea TaxID=3562 RepID=A0A9R0K4D0_SPIOL|nr:uncharacterized protein LOC110797226 [Spinacia oleracea]KNA23940.1 hypothetical protein SOVF_020520 [Spinacia oleracea]
MLTKNEGFLSWEERIISQDKGNRVVHYYLTHSVDDSVLAIKGTERSVRHMIYVVSDTFVEDYGTLCKVNAATKWRSRREVVDWLTKLVSKHQPPRSESLACGQPVNDRIRGSSGSLISHSPVMLPRKLKTQISDIVWNGVGWSCSKKLMHYPSFIRTGITISVHSFVFIMAAEGNHYLGYLEDMYEDKKRQKRVKVRWFHRDEEVTGLVSLLDAHPREVFITPHVQVINAECIGGPASVLTPKHYEQCVAILPQSILCRVHLCFRQFKNDQIRPFTVSKLLGYRNQAVLSCIDHLLFSKKKTKVRKFSWNQQDYSTIRDHIKQGCKRKRLDEGKNGDIKVRARRRAETSRLALGSRITKVVSSYPKLKIKLSGETLKQESLVGSHQEVSASFKINDEIELLSQDSGIRGCWFRCKVLEISRKHLKVQYNDLEDAENAGNLQEWVASCRVAAPDKMGLRCSGRLTTRPRPPEDSGDCILEVGTSLDVWLYDGWWEGVVIATNVCGTDHLQMYLPGEDRYMTVERSHVRVAKDWVNGSWVNAKTSPDILSYISAKSNSRLFDCTMPPISEVVEVEEDGQEAPAVAKRDLVLGNIGDNTAFSSPLNKKDNFYFEVNEKFVGNFIGCGVGNLAKDDRLGLEKDFEFCRQQCAQVNSVEAPVS